MNIKEVRYLPAYELRATLNDDGTRTLTGYAAVYNSMSLDMGGWRESIAPGAFARSVSTKADVVCLRDHDKGILLGRTKSGTLTLSEDATGLRFSCKLPPTSQATDLAALLERGDIDGCSFGFICNTDNWGQTPEGTPLRTLVDVDLFDVSVVSEPAYPDTSVSLRSAPKEVRNAIAKAVRAEKRDDDDEMDSAPDGCDCDCAACQNGDCADCDDPTCDDELCSGCPEQEAFRNYAHAQVVLAQLRAK